MPAQDGAMAAYGLFRDDPMSRCGKATRGQDDSDSVTSTITSGLFYFPNRNHILREYEGCLDPDKTESNVLVLTLVMKLWRMEIATCPADGIAKNLEAQKLE